MERDPELRAKLAKEGRLWGLALVCAAVGATTVALTDSVPPGVLAFLVTVAVLGPLLRLYEKAAAAVTGTPTDAASTGTQRTTIAPADTLRPDRGPRVHREVVSFVRRSARMRPNQRRAWEAHADRFVLRVPQRETSTSIDPGARLDLPGAFGRQAPLVVEIGPGPGDSLVAMAAARPDVDVLAFEVYEPAAAQLVSALHRAGLDNVRIVVGNAAEGLAHLVPVGGLDELWTFFPDPWPKAKHHKRRLVGPALAALVVDRLRPGGCWRLATDWEDYAVAMRAVLDAQPGLENLHPGGWAPRWAARPVTRFEQRGVDAGRSVHDLVYRRSGAGAR